MANKVISTIGYEGTTIDDFVAALKRDSINLLIDVRELPLSRKKGFSKNILAAKLDEHDIEYVHLKGLGDPKEGRMAARAGNYKLFESIFSKHLKTAIAKKDMDKAAELVRVNHACLMCFECDHTKCHRSIVAESLSEKTGLVVKALKVQDISVRSKTSKSLKSSSLHV